MGFEITDIGKGTFRVRMPRKDEFLRPGGTVNGPALMSLADYAMYVAVLSAIGRVAHVTATYSIPPGRNGD
jgi:acyl-coenzyme A thioesterase PaaI-like protein